jgi:predicted nucleotidyltransferase
MAISLASFGTPQHQQILQAIIEHYADDERILAVLVFGSLGAGNWDTYSDLDLDIVTTDGTSIDITVELESLCTTIKNQHGFDALIIPNNDEEGDVVLSNLVEFSIRYHALNDTKPAILDSMMLLTGKISLEQIQNAGEANRVVQPPNLTKLVNQCIRYTLELQNTILRQRLWMSLELLHYIHLLLMELFTITHQGIRPVQFFEANANPDLQERVKRILPHTDLESAKSALGEVIHILEHELDTFTNRQYQLTAQQRQILRRLHQTR